MGMYTKINLILRLHKTAKTLSFFNDDDFDWKDCRSCYFTDSSNTRLIDNGEAYILHLDCDMKDYGKPFLIKDFLIKVQELLVDECKAPDYEEFVGYIRYEEDLFPSLVWIKGGELFVDNSYRASTLEKYEQEE